MVKIDNLHIDVRQNYLNLALDPTVIVKPPVDPNHDNKLYISFAHWGPWSIMGSLRTRYENGERKFIADNSYWGDSDPGKTKWLMVGWH